MAIISLFIVHRSPLSVSQLEDRFSILLRDDVAYEIVQGRIGDLDLNELPRCG